MINKEDFFPLSAADTADFTMLHRTPFKKYDFYMRSYCLGNTKFNMPNKMGLKCEKYIFNNLVASTSTGLLDWPGFVVICDHDLTQRNVKQHRKSMN